jgi:hypothetical protein
VFLLLSNIFSIILVNNKDWFDRIEYYLINFVVLTFLIFALKQYSYYNKLRTDYANRKTIAQSYHNIITTHENESIRTSFIDKATDVLASKSEVSEESYTIPEKILESITEIAKNLSKK